MPDPLALFPIPPCLRPKVPPSVAAVADEVEIGAVGDLVNVDGKAGDLHPELIVLVIPPEAPADPGAAQRRLARGNGGGPPRIDLHRRAWSRNLGRRDLRVVRQLVQKIGEGLGVH